MRFLRTLAALMLALPLQALAHELRPVFLGLDEQADGRTAVRLKVPQFRDGSTAAVQVQFPPDCRREGAPRNYGSEDSLLQEWTLVCAEPLAGRSLRLQGLSLQTPDGLISLRSRDGAQVQVAVTRHRPEVQLPTPQTAAPAATLAAYLPIGVEHILLGVDHLLFVFGLLLLWQLSGARAGALVLSVTAFTLAHSLTLALSVLGGITLPAGPVEALIALSILMLAAEIVRALRLSPQVPDTLTFRKPWLIAFVFGLLHGFGFAGALAGTELPEQARGWALLLFNLGVELGQLLFLGAALLLQRMLRLPPQRYAGPLAWLMGSVAGAWTLDRTWQIFGA